MIFAALLHSVNGYEKNSALYCDVPVFESYVVGMHNIIIGSFKDRLLQRFLFHAGWMYQRSSGLGADDKIAASNKQGSSVVETGLFQEISGRNQDH